MRPKQCSLRAPNLRASQEGGNTKERERQRGGESRGVEWVRFSRRTRLPKLQHSYLCTSTVNRANHSHSLLVHGIPLWQMECTDFQWMTGRPPPSLSLLPQIGCDLQPKHAGSLSPSVSAVGCLQEFRLMAIYELLSPLFRVICGLEWQRPPTRPSSARERGARPSPTA